MGTFTTPAELPELAQAASLALALLRTAKVTSWTQLVAEPQRLAKVVVDPDQVALLNRHKDTLALLRHGSPAITLAVCRTCGRFSTLSGAAASKCPMTLGCTTEPVRVSAAPRTKPPGKPDDAMDDQAPPVDAGTTPEADLLALEARP